MAKEQAHDTIRVKIGFDIYPGVTKPDNIYTFIYNDSTPTKVPGAIRYMVVVDVPYHESTAPDMVTKDLAEVAEEVKDEY